MLFPLVIENIEDIRACIGNDTDFVIKEKGPFIYVNYKRMTTSTFPELFKTTGNLVDSSQYTQKEWNYRKMRREMRGLVLDKASGGIVARSMHKFFNINEREESSAAFIQKMISENPEMQVTVLEKLDGSLTSALLVPVEAPTTDDEDQSHKDRLYQLRFRSKMGYENDHTDSLEEFLGIEKLLRTIRYRWNESTSKYDMIQLDESVEFPVEVRNLFDFCTEWIGNGYTCLFEFFSHENRVVVDYDEPYLSLLAIRDTRSGVYIPHNQMVETAQKYGIPHVRSVPCDKFSKNRDTMISDLLEYCYKQERIEGYVVRLTDMSNPTWTEMYKTKTKWYSDIHRVRELIALNNMSEHYVWALVIDNCVDDALPTLRSEEDKEKLMKFSDTLSKLITSAADEMEKEIKNAREQSKLDDELKDTSFDMKIFAKYVAQVEKRRGSSFAKCMFRIHKDMLYSPDASVEDLVCKILKDKAQKSIPDCQSFLGQKIQFYAEDDKKKTRVSYVSRRRQRQQQSESAQTTQEQTQ